MILDAHVHAFPVGLGADPRGWGEANGESAFGALMAPRASGPVQDFPTRDALLAALDAAGVAAALVQGWYWRRPEHAAWHAGWLAGFSAGSPRLPWLAPFHPGGGEAAFDAVRRAVEEGGARGVGELHPGVQGFGWDDPGLDRMAAWLAERRLVLGVHVTDPRGRPYPGRAETPLAAVADFAARHPGLRLVLAHWGGGLACGTVDGVDPARLPESTCFDVSATPRLGMDVARSWSRALAVVGPRRLLFGSDYPLRLFGGLGAGEGLRRWTEETRAVLASLPAGDRDAILGGNLRGLLDADARPGLGLSQGRGAGPVGGAG